jgi:hypothetical protein
LGIFWVFFRGLFRVEMGVRMSVTAGIFLSKRRLMKYLGWHC